MDKIMLSPSSLNLFKNCKRCFWLEKNNYTNCKRPRGIFPSLPNGMDLTIKRYFSYYRRIGELPEYLKGKLPGHLFENYETMSLWRDWKLTNLNYEDKKYNAYLTGALDDCLVYEEEENQDRRGIDGNLKEEIYIPLDYKTKGSAPNQQDSEKYYGIQLSCYCLILEHKGYKTKGFGYLLYFYPEIICEDGKFIFNILPIRVETNIEQVKELFAKAVECILGNMPEANEDCEYCNFVLNRNETILYDIEGV